MLYQLSYRLSWTLHILLNAVITRQTHLRSRHNSSRLF